MPNDNRSYQSRVTALLSVLVIFSLMFGACSTPRPAPATEGARTGGGTPSTPLDSGLQVKDDGAPLPPQVVQLEPGGQQPLALHGQVVLTFDQPMNPQKTAGAWKMNAPDGTPIQGDISWRDARTMIFQPAGLQAGQVYRASLASTAQSDAGATLPDPLTFEFQTVTDLAVSQVFPADGAQEVRNDAVITAIFNRPVVPLVTSLNQANLVQPLEFDPPLAGKGEWISTSVYTFRPERLLSGAEYNVRIAAGLQDALGETQLTEDYQWRFSTAAPQVSFVEMSRLGWINTESTIENALLDEGFRIVFMQPMDPASTESHLKLENILTGEQAALTTVWSEEASQVVITPTALLEPASSYVLRVEPGAFAADGGSLVQGLELNLNTIPLPAVRAIYPPYPGSTGFDGQLRIEFTAPMNLESIKEHVTIRPAPKDPINWYYDEWGWALIAYVLEPSTSYHISVTPGALDIYGHAMQEGAEWDYTTPARDPSAYLEMPYMPALVRQDGEQTFYVNYRNVDSVRLDLYKLTGEEFVQLLTGQVDQWRFQPDEASHVWQGQEASTGGLNERVIKGFTPTASGQPLAPGFYFLGLNATGYTYTGAFADQRLIMVSTANLTLKTSGSEAFAWLTDLTSGAPVAGMPVTVYDQRLEILGRATTDDQGVAHLTDIQTPPPDSYESLFAIAGHNEVGSAFGFATDSWGSGVNLYDFGAWSHYYAPTDQPTYYLYTDRPLYRPGQPVYFKGIIRLDDDLAYTLPEAAQVHVRIENYKETVFETDLPLTEFGTFSGEFTLASETALGYYSLFATLDGQEISGSLSFNVAEYRKPEFQVNVEAAPAALLTGENFEITVSADYYSGGSASGADVAWSVVSAPYYFTPPEAFEGYSFQDIEEDTGHYFEYQPYSGSNFIGEGQGATGPDGKFKISLPAELSEGSRAQQFTFEATVTDIAQNVVSGRASVIAHPSLIYAGVRPTAYVGATGKETSFDLAAVDWNGKPLPGQSLDVEIIERNWYSVQEQDASGRIHWTSSVSETLVTTFTGITVDAKGKAQVSFTPEKGGIYKARVSGRDAQGNLAKASAYLWVAGKDYIPWRQSDDRNFELIADHDQYAPGDTAQILIASPFQGEAYALVTVERGHVKRHEVIRLTSNSTVYELPITPDLAPNAYVSVLVVKGVDEQNPRPNFKMGMLQLHVEPRQQALTVSLSADQEQAGPGDTVTYQVQVADAAGQPVQAEVSLSLSDLATLSLSGPNSGPILEYFYSRRSLSVWTAVPLVLSLEDYNISVEEAANEGQMGGSGGGKGDGDWGVMAVRQNFPDTALWTAHLQTDVDGRAQATVKLPDNLTIWRMDARAVTVDTRVGQTTMDMRSTKPLLVSPQTPRFFVVNDQTRLGTAVYNNTAQDVNVTVSLEAQGVTLQGEANQSVAIAAGQRAFVTWQATVNPDAERVNLIFRAESTGGEGLNDASTSPVATLPDGGIPVYRFSVPETVGTSGLLLEEGSRPEAIFLPESLDDPRGNLTIRIEHSLAAGMTAGLAYLEHFPNECVEQTISRFLPNVVTTRALRSANLSDPALEKDLEAQVSTALQRLSNWQNADGGWSWWPGYVEDAKSNPQVTAYAVLALNEASLAGYEVNPDMLERAVSYLGRQVKTVKTFKSQYEFNRQAFILYVLARQGSSNANAYAQLFEQRQQMALYARAFLALAIHASDPEDQRIQTLLTDIHSAAILSATGAHWEEEQADRWNWNTDTRTTAIVLVAMSRLDSKNQINANAVRWLMSHRNDGHWRGTQETAWSLMALTDWMTASGELQGNYEYAVALNGERLGGGQVTSENLREVQELQVEITQLLKGTSNRLAFARDGGSGNLYYTAHLNVYLPVEQVQPLDQGITISRAYYRPDDPETPVTEAKAGELLLVRLTVVTPGALHYAIVEDPLPAGLEAVDQSLLTSEQNPEIPQQFSWEDMWLRGWGWWNFERIEMKDEKVLLSATYLPAGTYVYTYMARALTPGQFQVIPPTAQEFYFPEVYGRGEGSLFTITP